METFANLFIALAMLYIASNIYRTTKNLNRRISDDTFEMHLILFVGLILFGLVQLFPYGGNLALAKVADSIITMVAGIMCLRRAIADYRLKKKIIREGSYGCFMVKNIREKRGVKLLRGHFEAYNGNVSTEKLTFECQNELEKPYGGMLLLARVEKRKGKLYLRPLPKENKFWFLASSAKSSNELMAKGEICFETGVYVAAEMWYPQGVGIEAGHRYQVKVDLSYPLSGNVQCEYKS